MDIKYNPELDKYDNVVLFPEAVARATKLLTQNPPPMAKKHEDKVVAAPTTTAVAVKDVVQIIDTAHPWFPGFLVVTELHGTKVQGYAIIINSNTAQDNGQAFIRIALDQVERIGKAVKVNE